MEAPAEELGVCAPLAEGLTEPVALLDAEGLGDERGETREEALSELLPLPLRLRAGEGEGKGLKETRLESVGGGDALALLGFGGLHSPAAPASSL